MEKTIGFIGSGRVVRILLQGFKNKNIHFEKVVVSDTSPEVINTLKGKYPDAESAEATVAASQDIVFIALHPPVIMEMLEAVKESIKPGSVVVSLAPKISLDKLKMKIQSTKNIARLIPNATSFINEGYNPVTFSEEFDPEKKKTILDLLSTLGKTFEVPEHKLECYAIMSAMLPTYFWFQWKELEKIGTEIGLTPEESKNSVVETLLAAISLMYKSGLPSAEVIDLIPVKPIGEHEQQVVEFYRTKLIGLFEKIKP